MKPMRKNDKCVEVRRWLSELDGEGVDLPPRMLRHLSDCPRCRALARGAARLSLTLMFARSGTHSPDLLQKANRRTVACLGHQLRAMPAAERLRIARPQPTLRQKAARYTQGVGHAAASFALLTAMNSALPRSLEQLDDQGRQFLKQYQANLDQALRDAEA